ncbi:MAG: MerR family transcriptional regulator [Eubacteriales bacterium]
MACFEKTDKLYSIGEVSEICDISKKALRFYDKIGIISPTYISEKNGYRYYDDDILFFVPIIKYFKQMGFKLEEMKEFLDSDSYAVCEKGFREKIEELKLKEEEIRVSHTSVRDWYNLIIEAESVLINKTDEVSVKFMQPLTTCYLEQDFRYDYRETIINIPWTNYLKSIDTEITGAVVVQYLNAKDKMEGKPVKSRILQKNIRPLTNVPVMTIWGAMAATCYHIGGHQDISNTYAKIYDWAERHGYECSEESVERYVIDYWTIRKTADFVTEVSINVKKRQE